VKVFWQFMLQPTTQESRSDCSTDSLFSRWTERHVWKSHTVNVLCVNFLGFYIVKLWLFKAGIGMFGIYLA
jgi:hypothetical protein